MSELQQITAFFDSYHLTLSNEWLDCCVEWCKSDCLPPNYTQQDLQVKIYEQWLLLDLREVQVASLPRGISSQKKFTLNGTYCLQMMQIVDISKPKLWQIQRIRNTVGKNVEPETDFGKRVLQMTLTDGVQEIEAFEFKPISSININLVPGIKIKIMGPITVRNGRLMLENHHVKVLGGEVEEIRISNAAENILARSLGLKENPNPFVIEESLLTANMEILDTSNRQGTQDLIQKPLTNFVDDKNQKNNIKNTLNNANRTKSFETKNNLQNSKKQSEENFEIDEELLREFQNDDFDDEIVDSSTTKNKQSSSNKNVNSSSKPKIARTCSSPDMFENMEYDDDLLNKHLDQLDKSLEASKNVESAAAGQNKDTNKETKIVSSSGWKNHDDDDDFFNNSDLDAHLDQLDAEMRELPSSTQHNFKTNVVKADDKETNTKCDNPINSCINQDVKKSVGGAPKSNVFKIEKLKRLQPNIGKGKFKIGAVFKEVVEKMRFDEETRLYRLVIRVNDDNDELLLNVHSDLVSDWMELSIESLLELKLLISQQDLVAIEKFKKALTKLRENVMNLNGVLEVEITRGQDHPLLIAVQNQ